MKILWLCSQPINIIAEQLKLPKVILGGWLEGIAENLSAQENIELFYLFPNFSHNKQNSYDIQNIQFIDFGIQGLDVREYLANFKRILENNEFDIIHVFGTENKILNTLVSECDTNKVVTSIQGIMTEIYKENLFSIFRYYKYSSSVKQIFAQFLLTFNQIQLYLRAKSETKVLKRIKNVIGRTEWDKKCIQEINPNIKYYHCNEILRNEFYKPEKWNIRSKEEYRIFFSQGSYPLKGLHFLLKAVADLKNDYPTIKVIVAGENVLMNQAITAKFGISYSNFIQEIINSESLNNHIHFTGALTETQVKIELLKSHIYINASTIENSPNALGEAMILGVPSICSNVGGIPSMINDNIDGLLFASGDSNNLSNEIRKLFEDEKLDVKLSKNATKNAEKRFNQNQNILRLVEIYKSISVSSGLK